jgi:rod shape-determining protein MreC
VLVTSGLDGVFPFGLPVARITKVDRDPTQPLAQIYAAPLARIESDREVLFIWARPGHPAAPSTPDAMKVEDPKPAAAAKPAPRPARKPVTPAATPQQAPQAAPQPSQPAPQPAPQQDPQQTEAPPATDPPPAEVPTP